MSLRITPQEDIGNSMQIPALILPKPKSLYQARAQQAALLAKDHPLGQYLQLIADISTAQAVLCDTHPVALPDKNPDYWTQALLHDMPPLNPANESFAWQPVLQVLVSWLQENRPGPLAKVYQKIQALSNETLAAQADAILQGTPEDMATAPFIGAALSYYWTQLASQLPTLQLAHNEQTHCPVCHTPPVAGVIHGTGLRYLHCALCETQWHMVRVKCTSCFATQHIHYHHLEDATAIQTETCDECSAYLKLFRLDKSPLLDVIADDIASLALDIKTEEGGYHGTGLNLLLAFKP
jgi:FdhE protein